MLCCAVLTMPCCAVLCRRRNFDRHFQEWRHAHGMRCLGIPNTKHFHDITLIQVLNIACGREKQDGDGRVAV